LFEQILHCLRWQQSSKGDEPSDVICRALLIIAYGIYELPAEGLALASEAHKIDLQNEVKTVFIDAATN
jgi:hypothetical protein